MTKNLFKIDFIQGRTNVADYGLVKHSLTDTVAHRVIITLSTSADKLQSVSNYTREPKRLVFECFPDTWTQENILSGSNEHERYISHFEVKAYRDDLLFFTGIIDTSQLALDVSSGILRLTCYDKIRLLSIYSDLTHYYSFTAGYLPIWILGYFLQDIEQTIPISIPYTNQCTLPALNVGSSDALTIAHVDFADLIKFPINTVWGWTYHYHSSGWPGPYYGFKVDVLANSVTFVFAYKKVIQAAYIQPDVYASQYQGRFKGRIIRFYNGICPVVSEYDEETGWESDLLSIDNTYNEFLGFFADNGISSNTLFNGLSSTGSIDGKRYGSSHYVNHLVKATCHGNLVPGRLQVGDAYFQYDDSQTENLKALQAMLMIYNATIVCSEAGIMALKSKEYSADHVKEISNQDLVSLLMKRGDGQLPDMNTLDVLAGDTTQLKEYFKEYLVTYHDSRWSCDLVIDNIMRYDLKLQDTILLQGKEYVVVEIDRDYVKDEYKVKAWLL